MSNLFDINNLSQEDRYLFLAAAYFNPTTDAAHSRTIAKIFSEAELVVLTFVVNEVTNFCWATDLVRVRQGTMLSYDEIDKAFDSLAQKGLVKCINVANPVIWALTDKLSEHLNA